MTTDGLPEVNVVARLGMVAALGAHIDRLFDNRRPPVLERQIEIQVGQVPAASRRVPSGEVLGMEEPGLPSDLLRLVGQAAARSIPVDEQVGQVGERIAEGRHLPVE